MKIKRLIDIIVSLVALIVLAPVIAVLYIAVLWSLGKPALFCQERPGLNEKPFNIYKFRSMLTSVDAEGKLLSDEQRLTRLGRFLRMTSLDELPELFNVIKGDMSLVGPRPLLLEYLPLYSERQRRRHEVRPGLTGWAQINGRNLLDWDKRFDLDVWYIDNWSLLLDIKIIAITIFKVLSREGISAQEHATMPKFTGPKFTGPKLAGPVALTAKQANASRLS